MSKAMILMFVMMGFLQTKEARSHFVNIASQTQILGSYPKPSKHKFLAISNLKLQATNGDVFNTEGFVAGKYACPPCPKGVLCEPCPKDHIIISEENKKLGADDTAIKLTDKDLIIFANKIEQFKTGRKYLFTVKVTEGKSTSESINDIELLGYRPLK